MLVRVSSVDSNVSILGTVPGEVSSNRQKSPKQKKSSGVQVESHAPHRQNAPSVVEEAVHTS